MLLLDENLSPKLVSMLSDVYPGITQSRFVGLLGKKDPEVWQYAKEHRLSIVTKDGQDFQELSARLGHPPKIIVLTIGNCRVSQIEEVLRSNCEKIVTFLANTAASVLTI